MRKIKKIRVNPGICELGYRIVEDDVGRRIEYKEGGTDVLFTTHISRALKSGDLVLIDKEHD